MQSQRGDRHGKSVLDKGIEVEAKIKNTNEMYVMEDVNTLHYEDFWGYFKDDWDEDTGSWTRRRFRRHAKVKCRNFTKWVAMDMH